MTFCFSSGCVSTGIFQSIIYKIYIYNNEYPMVEALFDPSAKQNGPTQEYKYNVLLKKVEHSSCRIQFFSLKFYLCVSSQFLDHKFSNNLCDKSALKMAPIAVKGNPLEQFCEICLGKRNSFFFHLICGVTRSTCMYWIFFVPDKRSAQERMTLFTSLNSSQTLLNF